MNHHEPKTSNRPRCSAIGAQPWLWVIQAETLSGLIGRCGNKLPSDAPAASNSRRINAVRIVRSCRHAARAIATIGWGRRLVFVVISCHGEGCSEGYAGCARAATRSMMMAMRRGLVPGGNEFHPAVRTAPGPHVMHLRMHRAGVELVVAPR